MPPALIDTHCHLNFPSFDDDRAAVLARAEAAGVNRIIVPAVDLRSCRQALQLAETHSGVYTAIGIHPNSSVEFDRASIGDLRDMASHRRVVAIGENRPRLLSGEQSQARAASGPRKAARAGR